MNLRNRGTYHRFSPPFAGKHKIRKDMKTGTLRIAEPAKPVDRPTG
jgi:hypothetical protein